MAHPPIACILDALDERERARSAELRIALAAAIVARRDLAEGFAFCLRGDARFVVEWISLERRCCPFLTFDLRWTPGEDDAWLSLDGPPGTKEFLASELGAGRAASIGSPGRG